MPEPATFANLACVQCGQRSPTILEMVLHCATTHLHMDVALDDKEAVCWLLGRCRDWQCLPGMKLGFGRN